MVRQANDGYERFFRGNKLHEMYSQRSAVPRDAGVRARTWGMAPERILTRTETVVFLFVWTRPLSF